MENRNVFEAYASGLKECALDRACRFGYTDFDLNIKKDQSDKGTIKSFAAGNLFGTALNLYLMREKEGVPCFDKVSDLDVDYIVNRTTKDVIPVREWQETLLDKYARISIESFNLKSGKYVNISEDFTSPLSAICYNTSKGADILRAYGNNTGTMYVVALGYRDDSGQIHFRSGELFKKGEERTLTGWGPSEFLLKEEDIKIVFNPENITHLE